MTLGKPDDQSPCVFDDPSRKIDQVKTESLHSLGDPGALKDEVLHCRIQIVGKDHDRPPRGVLPEVGRGKLPACEVLLHDRMGFF